MQKLNSMKTQGRHPSVNKYSIANLQELESFLAAGSWDSLDLHPLVANAFQKAGFQRPSQAQVCF